MSYEPSANKSSSNKLTRRKAASLLCLGSSALSVKNLRGQGLDPVAAQTGQWSAPLSWPLVAIHATVLPNGKVLVWSTRTGDYSSGNHSQSRLWDPATGFNSAPARPFTATSGPYNDIFCAGHTFLEDGRLLVAGGHIDIYKGTPYTNIYDWESDQWSAGPNMNISRWYPTTCTTGSGEAVVVAGHPSPVTDPVQIWHSGDRWKDLAANDMNGMLSIYQWLHLAPNGEIFVSGPDSQCRFLNTSGKGSWSTGTINSQYGYRDYGSSVMLDHRRVLITGGGAPTNTAEMIDLGSAQPKWQNVSPMAQPRRLHYSTVLPDGTVLVTGGTRSPGFDLYDPIFQAELYNPANGSWTTLASMKTPRGYHSVAVLLPDGRVLLAGGGQSGGYNPDQPSAEIFSPPYLFRGPRPVINGIDGKNNPGNTTFKYNSTISVQVLDSLLISDVTLVRLSSVTHSFNMNQRFYRPSFTRGLGTLNVSIPNAPDSLPPGHYLLFVLNALGVPSVGKVIRIGKGKP